MNKVTAFRRQYKYEIIGFVVNVASAIFSYLLIPPVYAFVLTIGVFTLSVFVVIYFKTKDRDFYFMPLDKPGSKKDWVGRGKLEFIRNENCYEITEADVGYIFPKTANWDDYKFECDFKIVKKYFGCIVRAMNLSNYVMFQLRQDNYIKVHLRINGEWIVIEKTPFDGNLKLGSWYGLSIVCEKRSVKITVKDKDSKLFESHFTIPPVIKIKRRVVDATGKETIKDTKELLNIDFDFGSVGVRNAPSERAFFKNVYLEKLD